MSLFLRLEGWTRIESMFRVVNLHTHTHTHTQDFHDTKFQNFLFAVEIWDHLSTNQNLDSERCLCMAYSSLLEQMKFWGHGDPSFFAYCVAPYLSEEYSSLIVLQWILILKPDQVVGVACDDLHVFLLFLLLLFPFCVSSYILVYPCKHSSMRSFCHSGIAISS